MAALIRSPRIGALPRMLHTPRGADAAGAVSPAAQEAATSAAPSPAEAEPKADPELLARLEAAESRATTAMAELEELHADLERRRDEARASGAAEGHAEGMAQARAELREKLERVGACLEALRHQTEERLAHQEDAIVEVVLASLGKLLGPAMSTREGVAAAVRSVCEQIGRRDAMVVRLAPGDRELLAEETDLLGSLAERVQLEADPSVELGGCIVESAGGTLDGRLEVQLENLRQTLRRARSGGETEVGS